MPSKICVVLFTCRKNPGWKVGIISHNNLQKDNIFTESSSVSYIPCLIPEAVILQTNLRTADHD